MSELAQLLPAAGPTFRLELQRGDLPAFLAPGPTAPAVLGERIQWLREAAERHLVAGTGPAVAAAWQEVAALAATWGLAPPAATPRQLGERLEPDLVLLVRDAAGLFRVAAGVVVFPSHWSLPDKVGRTLAETHDVVPGLNPALGPVIDRFLDRLKPDLVAARVNWGLAATDAFNLHPALARPRLEARLDAGGVWLRVERQILVKLPGSGAILFGIRIELHPLGAVLADPAAKAQLHLALAAMPDALAAYKGLAAARPELLRLTA